MRADDIIHIDTGARHVRISVQDIRDAERRQTQRRMIAALYWRAGECMVEHDRLVGLVSLPENRWIAVSMMDAAQREHAEAISLGRAAIVMASAMEAAL